MRAVTSIIIITHNEGGNLMSTLDSIVPTISDGCEVVIVDDQSTDGSVERAVRRYRSVKVVRTPRRSGITGSRNLGASIARGDVLVFSDAHMTVSKGWLEPLREALERPDIGEVAPAVYRHDNRRHIGYGFTWHEPSLSMRWLYPRPSALTDVPFLCGCFTAMRRDVFEAIGRFDEGLVFWGSEDAELSLRVWRAGYRCCVIPASQVGHLFRPAFPYSMNQTNIIHNTLRMAALHFDSQPLTMIIRHFTQDPRFAEAFALLIASDVSTRRAWIETHSLRSAEWFFQRFGITFLAR